MLHLINTCTYSYSPLPPTVTRHLSQFSPHDTFLTTTKHIKHYYTSPTTLETFFLFLLDHMLCKILQLILINPCFGHLILPHHITGPTVLLFCKFSHSITQNNCLKIKSVLTSSSSHGNMDLHPPIYHSSTFDTIHDMQIVCSTFPSFPVAYFLAMTLVYTQ